MSELIWQAAVHAIPDVETWNANLGELKRLAEQYGPECKKFLGDEAARRGYVWHGSAKQYIHPWSMHPCKGKNVIGAGWKGGQLAVIFQSKDGPRRYESVAKNVPQDVAQKLINSPYPDKLYALIVKDKIQMMRVG